MTLVDDDFVKKNCDKNRKKLQTSTMCIHHHHRFHQWLIFDESNDDDEARKRWIMKETTTRLLVHYHHFSLTFAGKMLKKIRDNIDRRLYPLCSWFFFVCVATFTANKRYMLIIIIATTALQFFDDSRENARERQEWANQCEAEKRREFVHYKWNEDSETRGPILVRVVRNKSYCHVRNNTHPTNAKPHTHTILFLHLSPSASYMLHHTQYFFIRTCLPALAPTHSEEQKKYYGMVREKSIPSKLLSSRFLNVTR